MSTRLFTITVTASGVPTWAAGLNDGQVRTLTGSTYGPTNGVETLYSLLGQPGVPTGWQKLTGSPINATAIYGAWNGGRGDVNGKRLFVHGGGHGDSANNGLYYYDFTGATRPTGWVYAPNSLSAVASISSSRTVYPDNRPTAVHTYDALAFSDTQQRFYRFGGAAYSSGSGALGVYHYDLNAQAWSSVTSGGAAWGSLADVSSKLNSTVLAAPDDSKFLYCPRQVQSIFYTASSGAAAFSGVNSPMNGDLGTATSAPGPRSQTADKWLVVDDGNAGKQIYLATVNWSTNAISWGSNLYGSHASHAALLPSGLRGGSIFYDPSHSLGPCWWMFGFDGDMGASAMSTSLYRMDATTYAVTVYPLSAAIDQTSPYGSFNRHAWFPDWRVVCTTQHVNQPMTVFKVPN